MHEPVMMNCSFGCQHEAPLYIDSLDHYVFCTPLWLLAAGALGCVPPLDISERLCLVNPSVTSIQTLALAFQGYHYAKSLVQGEGVNRLQVQDSKLMQDAVQDALLQFKHDFCG